MNVTCRTCIGGTDIKTDKAAFEKGAQIVVGTPTRLEDVMTRKFLKVNQIKLLVVLKADEQFQDEFHKTFLKVSLIIYFYSRLIIKIKSPSGIFVLCFADCVQVEL